MINGLKIKAIKAVPGWIIRHNEHSAWGETLEEALLAWLDNYRELYGAQVKSEFEIVLPLAE